jgi:radical SAM protein with 4Fe4S-binding SPASM domain
MPEKIKDELLSKCDLAASDQIIVTDDMELLWGEDLVKSALNKGQNFLMCRRAPCIKKARNFPNRVLLELTSKCNSYCSMCPRNSLTRGKIHMDVQLAKKVIQELGEVGLNGLWLYNIGESLLHPNFFEILEFCRQFPSLGTIWLSTNGGIVDEEMRHRLLEFPVDILNYSLNAMSEEGFHKISPQLDFFKVRSNLRELVELKKRLKKKKPIIRVQMMEMPYLMHEIDQFKEEYGPYVDVISVNKVEVFSQNIESLSSQKSIVFNTNIGRCNRLEREDYMIFSNGTVSCCSTDFNGELNIGNVKTQTVKEIFEGEEYQALISQYREGRLHENKLCARCQDYYL